MAAPKVKRREIERFFEDHNILHSLRVEFNEEGFIIWSYRRDEQGQFVRNQRRDNERILDVRKYNYAD